jgi:hypothetical protein
MYIQIPYSANLFIGDRDTAVDVIVGDTADTGSDATDTGPDATDTGYDTGYDPAVGGIVGDPTVDTGDDEKDGIVGGAADTGYDETDGIVGGGGYDENDRIDGAD